MTLQEQIAVMQHYEKTQDLSQIECLEVYNEDDEWGELTFEPLWDWVNHSYRIKQQPTREEITAQWVKDNNLKVGDRVKVVRKSELHMKWNVDRAMENCINKIGIIHRIDRDFVVVDFIDTCWNFDVECLERVKEEYVPYTFEDRELFRNQWLRPKSFMTEFMVYEIAPNGILCGSYKDRITLSEAFEKFEYLDGRPFGKLKQ